MGLFSKETCTFCNTEVGALKPSKLATKEYICNDCKRKTNRYAHCALMLLTNVSEQKC